MPEHFDLIVRNGTVVDAAGRRPADLGVRDGRLAAVAPHGLAGYAARELDAAGRFVLPGLIDGHVHFREPGLEHKEDWLTGSRAAVMGGITTVIDMPNTLPPTAGVEQAREKAAMAAQKSYCDFGLLGLVGSGTTSQLAALASSGLVVGFKVFLGLTLGSIPPPSEDDLAAAMLVLGRLGFRLGAHAEDQALIERATARLRADGRTDPLAHLESRPVRAEVAAIERLSRLAAETRCPVHVFHLSSADGLAAIEAASAAGVDVTCETTAHYCFLSADDVPRLGGLSRVNPPLRPRRHGEALLAGLADGRITCIASDHAPHAPEDKAGPEIWQVAPGIAGIETTLPLFLTDGVHAGRLTLEQLVAAFAERPARTWSLWPRKGSLRVGSDADLTIVDLDRPGLIRGAELHGRHGLTPFEGRPTRGAPVATIVRGRVVMQEGELVGEPGWGRIVERVAAGKPLDSGQRADRRSR